MASSIAFEFDYVNTGLYPLDRYPFMQVGWCLGPPMSGRLRAQRENPLQNDSCKGKYWAAWEDVSPILR